MFTDILKTLKINHYIKNIVIFIPLIFSCDINSPTLWINTFIAFFAFCMISSAVYIFNDIADIKEDKLHKIKKKRPIASGKISKRASVCLMILLFVASFCTILKINFFCLLTILSYFILNVLYSLILKKIALIDTICIAMGFVLRVLCAYCAILKVPYFPIIIFVFVTSLFFTFLKRKLEFENYRETLRNSIKNFSIKSLDKLILISSVLSVVFYFICTIKNNCNNYLFLSTIPFSVVIFRFLFIDKEKEESPIKYIEKDWITKSLIGLYFIVLAIILII